MLKCFPKSGPNTSTGKVSCLGIQHIQENLQGTEREGQGLWVGGEHVSKPPREAIRLPACFTPAAPLEAQQLMPFKFMHSHLPEFKRICSQFSSCSCWFCYGSPQGPARGNCPPGALPHSKQPTHSQEQTSPLHQEQGTPKGSPQSHWVGHCCASLWFAWLQRDCNFEIVQED